MYSYLARILQFPGGDVWVLSIKNVKFNDSGVYACEVNSDPVVRSFHSLSGWLNLVKCSYRNNFIITHNNNTVKIRF